MNQLTRVVVLTPDAPAQRWLSAYLGRLGYQPTAFGASAEALRAILEDRFHSVIVDVRAIDLDTLATFARTAPGAGVIALVNDGDVALAAQAGRRGASCCLGIPFESSALERALHDARAAPLASSPAIEHPRSSASWAMRDALRLAERAAQADVPVLLHGESGSGKGLLAELIHTRSPRRDRPFVVVSCPTLPEALLASELFGHKRGAFTHAITDRAGRVEAAHGGTLFLDEIGEIPPALQAQLLRFLQDRSFERLGENRTRRADVRILAATHRDLRGGMESGGFRADLYYRLSVLEIHVPPLRQRRDDILALAAAFLEEAATALGRPAPVLSGNAQALLLAYPWPGNVRELKNEMTRSIVLQDGDSIEAEALSARLREHGAHQPVLGGDFTLEAIEREHVERVISRYRTLEQASLVLGIDDSTLWRKRKRYARDARNGFRRHVA